LSNIGATLTGLTGSFNRASIFKSFNVGQFAGSVTNEKIQFKVNGTLMEEVAVSGTGLYTLVNPLILGANQDVEMVTSGTNTDPVLGSLVRIDTFNADLAPTPGPLPLLGAATAFGWTRRLRHRIQKNSPSM